MTFGWIEYIIIVVSSARDVMFSKSANNDYNRSLEENPTTRNIWTHIQWHFVLSEGRF